jgi:hypothetical protein
MDIQRGDESGVLAPQQAADFVAEMLKELAALTREAGLNQSGDLIMATIPMLKLESDRDQSDCS